MKKISFICFLILIILSIASSANNESDSHSNSISEKINIRIENAKDRLFYGIQGLDEEEIKRGNLNPPEVERIYELKKRDPKLSSFLIFLGLLKLILIPLFFWIYWAVRKKKESLFVSILHASPVFLFLYLLLPVFELTFFSFSIGLSSTLVIFSMIAFGSILHGVCLDQSRYELNKLECLFMFGSLFVFSLFFFQKPLISWDELMNWMPYGISFLETRSFSESMSHFQVINSLMTHPDYPPIFRMLLMSAYQVSDVFVYSIYYPVFFILFLIFNIRIKGSLIKKIFFNIIFLVILSLSLNSLVGWVPYANFYVAVMLALYYFAGSYKYSYLLKCLILFACTLSRPEGFVYCFGLVLFDFFKYRKILASSFKLVVVFLPVVAWDRFLKYQYDINETSESIFTFGELFIWDRIKLKLQMLPSFYFPELFVFTSVWIILFFNPKVYKHQAFWFCAYIFAFNIGLLGLLNISPNSFDMWIDSGFIRYCSHTAILFCLLLSLYNNKMDFKWSCKLFKSSIPS